MSPLLTLTGPAFLARLDDHKIILHFEGLHYASDEVVPCHISRARLQGTRQTAGEYVAHYMAERHDAEREEWPEIARQFVPGCSSR